MIWKVGAFCLRHAHLWKFIEKLKEDSSLNQMALNQMQMAQKMTEAANSLQLCAYWELNNHIWRVVEGDQINNITDFPWRISQI